MKKLCVAVLLAVSTFGASGVALADSDYAEHKAQQVSKITYAQAAEIAKKAIGGGVVTDVDFELSYTGKHYYDVEVKKDYQEYDVRIDANSGKVLDASGVALADSEYTERKAQQVAKITYEQAAEIAQKAIGGGVVTDVDFELSYTGRHYYDVEVKKGYQEYDVRIDANSGEVLRQRFDD